jgi:CRISPR-associated protein Cas1
VTIDIDDALIAATSNAVARARALVEEETPPPPLVDSPKCNGCSLVGICLPDEINMLRSLEPSDSDAAKGDADGLPGSDFLRPCSKRRN